MYFFFCFKCTSCVARMPACVFRWKHVFENVSITAHKQPQKKLVLQKTVPSVPFSVELSFWKGRGDHGAWRWDGVERGWGARSKSFKKKKRQKRKWKQTKQTHWAIWTPLAWLRNFYVGVFLISVNFWRGGGFLRVGSMRAQPLRCWGPLPACCSPAARCTSCSLGRANLVGSSQLLPALRYFRWHGTETVCFSSSQCLQHQHDVQINIFYPSRSLAAGLLLLSPQVQEIQNFFPRPGRSRYYCRSAMSQSYVISKEKLQRKEYLIKKEK